MTSPVDVSAAPVRTPADYGRGNMVGTGFQPGMNRQNPPSSHGGPATAGLQVVVSGPLFDGMAQAAVAAMLDDIQQTVAGQALAEVQLVLDRSIQHPTPYYETQVTTQRAAEDWVVHDRGIVYGPWLEGVSRRNAATRFRGYHAFRRATEQLRIRIPTIIGPIVARYVRGLNG